MLWEKHKAFLLRMLAESFCNLIWSYIFKCIYFFDLKNYTKERKKKKWKTGETSRISLIFFLNCFLSWNFSKLFFLDGINSIRLQKFEFCNKNKTIITKLLKFYSHICCVFFKNICANFEFILIFIRALSKIVMRVIESFWEISFVSLKMYETKKLV